MSANAVPGRTSSAKLTRICASATIVTGSPDAISSTVILTPPSIEFSIGTRPKSTSPDRTASITSGTVSIGTSTASSPSVPGRVRRACSVNVPAGPK